MQRHATAPRSQYESRLRGAKHQSRLDVSHYTPWAPDVSLALFLYHPLRINFSRPKATNTVTLNRPQRSSRLELVSFAVVVSFDPAISAFW